MAHYSQLTSLRTALQTIRPANTTRQVEARAALAHSRRPSMRRSAYAGVAAASLCPPLPSARPDNVDNSTQKLNGTATPAPPLPTAPARATAVTQHAAHPKRALISAGGSRRRHLESDGQREIDSEGIRTFVGRAQWISSRSPQPLGHAVLSACAVQMIS